MLRQLFELSFSFSIATIPFYSFKIFPIMPRQQRNDKGASCKPDDKAVGSAVASASVVVSTPARSDLESKPASGGSSAGSASATPNSDVKTARGRGRAPKLANAVPTVPESGSSPAVASAVQTNGTASDVATKAPRGRGRPPKVKTNVAAAPAAITPATIEPNPEPSINTARGRGRPSKAASGALAASIASSSPVARSIAAAASPATDGVSDPAVKALRGRGRPPKAAPADPSPSAPPIVPSVSVAKTTAPDDIGKVARGRGRPPKAVTAQAHGSAPVSRSGAHVPLVASEVPSDGIASAIAKASVSVSLLKLPEDPPTTSAENEAVLSSASKKSVTPRGKKRSEPDDSQVPNNSDKAKSSKVRKLSPTLPKGSSVSKSDVAPPGSTSKSVKKGTPSKNSVKQRRTRGSHARPIYDDVWKQVYLAGTEWDQLQLVYNVDWEFEHLDDALTDGDLAGKTVYLFGSTEPQLLKMNDKDENGEVVPVPVIIAVVSDMEAPNKIGLKSVQKAEEEIVPMSDLRMSWQPLQPGNLGFTRVFKPTVHVMKCNERRARLRNMNEEAVHRYDYVLPYFFNPDAQDDVDVKTEVDVLIDLEGRQAPLMCQFDFELDDLDEFVEEQVTQNELDAGSTGVIKKAIQDTVKAAKLKAKQQKEDRKKGLEKISAGELQAIRNTKLIKFYPLNEWPDISGIKSKYINRYYGQAHELRDELPDDE